jgi:hypothetical protein
MAYRVGLSTNTSRATYALRAWLVAVVPSLLYFAALVAIGADSLRPPAGALDATFALYSILGAPLLETALMLPLAFLLARMLPRQTRLQIAVLAVAGALAHGVGGSWRQVLASFWPFLIYSVTLTTWLKRSATDAFVLTALVHALYNATFFVVGAVGHLMAADGLAQLPIGIAEPQ